MLRNKLVPVGLFLFAGLVFFSCKEAGEKKTAAVPAQDSLAVIKTDTIRYQKNGINYISLLFYDTTLTGKRPAILVVPEWWGLNDYAVFRAKELAQLGYIAMATDMYGNGKTGATPDDAASLSAPFYADPHLTKTVLDAALQQIKNFPQTDTTNIGAVGYCYGGYVVLNAAKLGADLKAVVSIHGGLQGVTPVKNLLKAQVLVCQGGKDSFELENLPHFKKEMDAVGANYTVIVYPDATHAFSNPAATELGKKFNIPIMYNAAADSASRSDEQNFFKKILQ